MEYDVRDEHDCFAAVGKLVVRFSSLDTSFTSVAERLIECAEATGLGNSLPDSVRTYDKRTRNKLARLQRIFSFLDSEQKIVSDFSKWRTDVKSIQTVRDDLCHGHCELNPAIAEPHVSIVTERGDKNSVVYHLAATELEILSSRVLYCSNWLYAAMAHIKYHYLNCAGASFYTPYSIQSICDALPSRPWENPRPHPKTIVLSDEQNKSYPTPLSPAVCLLACSTETPSSNAR